MISPQAVIRKSLNQVSCDLGEEEVILDLDDGIYYSVESVAAFVWRSIQSTVTFEELRRNLMDRFDVEVEQCRADLSKFLEQLEEKGLIEIVLDGASIPGP